MHKSAPWLDGWNAHKYGHDVNGNPYQIENSRYSYNQWDNGWCARFSAIKHDKDLEYDEVEGF